MKSVSRVLVGQRFEALAKVIEQFSDVFLFQILSLRDSNHAEQIVYVLTALNVRI
jgi:hypothetical protein